MVLEQKGIPWIKIRAYGFAFEGKKVLIDGGKLEELEIFQKNRGIHMAQS